MRQTIGLIFVALLAICPESALDACQPGVGVLRAERRQE